MKKIFLISFLLISISLTSCNITNKMGNGDIPLPANPTHIEFYNGGTCIGSYDNAIVKVASVRNTRLIGADITWYYYEIYVNSQIVDTIVDSEALAIKYKGSRF